MRRQYPCLSVCSNLSWLPDCLRLSFSPHVVQFCLTSLQHCPWGFLPVSAPATLVFILFLKWVTFVHSSGLCRSWAFYQRCSHSPFPFWNPRLSHSFYALGPQKLTLHVTSSGKPSLHKAPWYSLQPTSLVLCTVLTLLIHVIVSLIMSSP